MASQAFTPLSLDNLINEVAGTQEELDSELAQYGGNAPATDPAITNMVNQKTGLTVDFGKTYSQLERLIDHGNNALAIIQAIDPDTSSMETVGAVSSLMNAIRGCVAEFNKIHLQHIKYQQTLDLIEVKHQNKLKEIQARNNSNEIVANQNSIQPEWNSNDMLLFIQWKRERAAKLALEEGN